VVLAAWWRGEALPAPGVPGGAVAAALAVGCVVLTAQVLPARVDVDAAAARRERSVGVGAGLAAGDALAAGRGRRPPAAPWARRCGAGLLRGGLVHRAPVAARDLAGLARRPVRAAASLVLGAVGAALVLTALPAAGAALGVVSPATGRLVLGALLLYAASGTWADGLRAFGAQPVPGGLLPGAARAVLAQHGAVPAAAAVAATGLAAGVLAARGDLAGGVLPAAGAWLVAVLAARAWVAGGTLVPAALFTPVATPMGDASVLVVASWYVRGWLLLGALAWLGGPLSGAAAVLVPLAVAAVLALLAAGRADRV
jgi:hypothetical protein